ncbi:MAG: winged helix-turn-helix transcriptional regulator [Pirellulales bacterium]|nr:winged helix-turn-helix transcriptional regulator [Pirellulales bacterium]
MVDWHDILVESRTVRLSGTEYSLLSFLVAHPDRVLTRREILDGMHGDRYAITDRAIDVQLVSLRRKLGAAAKAIETVRGAGYRLLSDQLPGRFSVDATLTEPSSDADSEIASE